MEPGIVNIENAAHVLFFNPEWEEEIMEDLIKSNLGVKDIKEKLQIYSLQIISSNDGEEQRCLEEVLAYLGNLLNVLTKKGLKS